MKLEGKSELFKALSSLHGGSPMTLRECMEAEEMSELPKEWSQMWLESQREIAALRLQLTNRECDLADAVCALVGLLKLREETPMTEADAYHSLFKSSGAFEWQAAAQIARKHK